MNQRGAFSGVTVLDLAQFPGGALAAMHLGEFGADVFRPDVPEAGPFADDVALRLYAHRNKRTLPHDPARIAELLTRTDVVIVDRPRAELAAMGLTSAQLRARHAALVHAWMPPQAARGAKSMLPADELLLAAWTGMADQQPGATRDQPVAPVVPILTYQHGALGAVAIAAALVGRSTTGHGRALTVAGLHAVAALNCTIMVDLPGIIRPFGAQKDGTGSSPVFRMYRCRDGRWVFLCALTVPFILKVLDALDLVELLMAEGIDGDLARLFDPEIQQRVGAEFARRIAQRDLDEWARVFDAAGVPYAPVQSRDEWAQSETIAVNGLLCQASHLEYGAVTWPGVPVELAATPGRIELQPSPSRSTEPTREAPAKAHDEARLPLDGLVAVDATKFVAGPFASLLLQDLGASVIKVEPVGGEDFRAVAGASYSALNRGKEQVALDLGDRADREAFSHLVRRSDILLENISTRVAAGLGLDLSGFSTDNTGLVHAHIEGWGPGPLEERPAFDPLLQARSGLMEAQGGPDTPVLQAPSVHDIGAGTFLVFGILAALHARSHLGTGQEVRISLSRASLAFQGAEFTRYQGRPDPPRGALDHLGDGPAHRMYGCEDGWVAIGASPTAMRAGFARMGASSGDDEAAAEEYCATRSVESVLEALAAGAVPAVRVLPRDEIYTSQDLAENAFFTIVVDDDLGEVLAVRGFSDWEGVQPAPRSRNHATGSDTHAHTAIDQTHP